MGLFFEAQPMVESKSRSCNRRNRSAYSASWWPGISYTELEVSGGSIVVAPGPSSLLLYSIGSYHDRLLPSCRGLAFVWLLVAFLTAMVSVVTACRISPQGLCVGVGGFLVQACPEAIIRGAARDGSNMVRLMNRMPLNL